LYHPKPPEGKRERLYDGTLDDNYLYKTYVYKGKSYKNGVWVLDIQDYKTLEIYSPQSILVPNRQFADGTCLYDHIERYLYGWWTPGGRKNQFFYDWWQPELLGRRGRWITLGRAEFNPRDVCCPQDKTEPDFWSWGYLFVQPRVGLPLNGSEFADLVEVPAHRLTGKYISPHTMRAVWATWAFQVGLTDQQKESLAYAMGHKVKTLKTIYERCTPDEKRRPIEEAIDELLFETLQSDSTPDPAELARQLEKLTLVERQSLVQMLSR
jgi:integrase